MIGDEGTLQLLDDVEGFLAPVLFPDLLERRFADLRLDDFVIHIGQIAELERKHVAFPNQRGAEPGAEAEEQHPAVAITPERLQRRIVDHARRLAERLLEIIIEPAFAEMLRLIGRDLSIAHRRGKTDRHRVVFPIARLFLDAARSFPPARASGRREICGVSPRRKSSASRSNRRCRRRGFSFSCAVRTKPWGGTANRNATASSSAERESFGGIGGFCLSQLIPEMATIRGTSGVLPGCAPFLPGGRRETGDAECSRILCSASTL